MNVIPTAAAAGVAQTALQAQEVARHREGRASGAALPSARVRKSLEAKLRSAGADKKSAAPAGRPLEQDMSELATNPQGKPDADSADGRQGHRHRSLDLRA